MSWWDKLTAHGEGENPPPKLQRRTFWGLAGLAALGVALIFLGNVGRSTPEKPSGSGVGTAQTTVAAAQERNTGDSSMSAEERDLELKLQKMLSQVAGAGQVEVTVHLASSNYEDYAVNASTTRKTTQEKDQSGGTRLTTENTDSDQMVLLRENQGDVPVVRQERAASIAGVLVVAQGASDPLVKARLFEAVQVALGVEPQKVLVLPREGGGS